MQEPKYQFEDGRVINRVSGDAIPLDEPVFIFRGRDRHAARVLAFYASVVADEAHRDAIIARLDQFNDFATDHPERMKEPDTEGSSPHE